MLFGDVNPSGHLPITFPAQLTQLPRPVLDGFFDLEPNFFGTAPSPDSRLSANYNLEGSDVGYRWFARSGQKPLFPFGFGLSYTKFSLDGLQVSGQHAQFVIRNIGARSGADVAQLYLVSRAGKQCLRLVGFQKVDLAPGASRTVSIDIDPRLLADWGKGQWNLAAGDYSFALGTDAEHLMPAVTARFGSRHWSD